MLRIASNGRITGSEEDGGTGVALNKGQGLLGRGQPRPSLPMPGASDECSAVVRAQGMGRGWLARDEAAGKGRLVTKALWECEIRKGGEGCLCFRETLPGAVQRRDGGKRWRPMQ